MRRALCWLTKAFLSFLSLKKRTVQPIFVSENMNLFVHGCRGQTWQNTLIQMCHSESLLSSPADDIWNETRLSQSVLYWIHQSHTARWQLCLSLKGPGLDDRVVTHGCSICLHCAIYLDCFLPLFILFFFPLTVFVLCVTRTYKVFTWWLWCRMTILQRFLQRGLGKKRREKRYVQLFADCIFNSVAARCVIQITVASVTPRLLRLLSPGDMSDLLIPKTQSLPRAAPSFCSIWVGLGQVKQPGLFEWCHWLSWLKATPTCFLISSMISVSKTESARGIRGLSLSPEGEEEFQNHIDWKVCLQPRLNYAHIYNTSINYVKAGL